MICPTCGAQVHDGLKFCENCGTRLEATQAPAMPAEPFKDMPLVARSRFFDGAYYLRDNADVARVGMESFVHYARYGTTPDRNPSVQFIGDEYLAVNPDVGYAKVHPLVHYERHGRTEGRLISFLENDRAPSFPKGAVPLSRSTVTSVTPGTLCSACSARALQRTHIMPVIFSFVIVLPPRLR